MTRQLPRACFRADPDPTRSGIARQFQKAYPLPPDSAPPDRPCENGTWQLTLAWDCQHMHQELCFTAWQCHLPELSFTFIPWTPIIMSKFWAPKPSNARLAQLVARETSIQETESSQGCGFESRVGCALFLWMVNGDLFGGVGNTPP